MPDTFDVAVIGGGSAGYVGAIRGAQLGLKVAVIEKEKLGGTCLHRGCIPTKSFLHSSELAHQFREAAGLGLKTDGLQIDWPAVLKRKEAVVTKLWQGVEFLMKKNKITVFKGQGIIEAKDRVVVKETGETVTAKNLVVATGSEPKSLPGLVMDGDSVINSDHAVNLQQMPKSLVIVGAGAVGTEFACVYNGYGGEVTLVEFLPTLLPLEDQEVGQMLARILTKRGIKVLTNKNVTKVNRTNNDSKSGQFEIWLDDDSKVTADKFLVATGRQPNTNSLERSFELLTEVLRF
jgi:dihydrolipoamide dehydrogenase